MSIRDESTASRQFVASAAIYSTKWIKGTKYWQVGYTIFFVAFVAIAGWQFVGTAMGAKVRLPISGKAIAIGMMAGLVLASVAFGAYVWWRSRRKYLVTVTGEGLTINQRPGDVYSLADAQLALWVRSGVALALHSGGRSFVLGGRDRRIAPTTPLDAEPVSLVDASLSASDFDELLLLGGRATARGPAPGQPTRCVLYPNSPATGSRKKQQLIRSAGAVQLFLDIDHDFLRVIDPNSNAVNGSAPVSRVTATALTYEIRGDEGVSRTPTMMLGVPGMEPFTVGCLGAAGRIAWSGGVPITKQAPTCTLSAADWLTLLETFGLTKYQAGTAK